MKPSRWREAASALLLVLGGTMAGLLIAEAALRCFPLAGVRLESFRLSEAEAPYMLIMNRAKRRGFYRPSALLGYEHEPHVRGRTNRHGLMGRGHPLEKRPGVFRVLLLGDSIAEPFWSGETLEEALNFLPQGSGSRRRFEVWNAGTGSYDIRRYSLFLRHRGLRFRPDLAVVFLSMNDFGIDTNTYYRDKDGFIGYHFPLMALRRRGFVPNRWLLRRIALYRFALMRAEVWVAARDGSPELDQRETGRRYVAELLRTGRENSLPVLFVVFPYLEPPGKLDARQRSEYEIITGILSESGAAWLDLSALFEKLRREGFLLRLEPQDRVHPSWAAHKEISREIAGALRGRGVL